MRGRWMAGIAFGALSALAACQLIVGVEDERGAPRPAGTPEAGLDAGPVDPCRKLVPLLPTGAGTGEAGSGTDPDLIFAVRKFVVQRPDRVIGYDLDERCTGIDGSTTADPPCVGASVSPDSVGGVDNGIARILDKYKIISGSEDPVGEGATNNIGAGIFTNLIGVFGYNRTPNDPSVQVRVVVSVGLQSTGCDGGTTDPDAGRVTPQWDGCDTWSHTEGIQDGTTPIWSALQEGYVVDDTLVVRIPEARLSLFIGDFAVYDGVVTARIERNDGGVTALRDGIFAGRAHAGDLLRSVQFLNFNRTVVCENDVLFDDIKRSLCEGRDVPRHRADDGRGSVCDAISVGFGFEAEPARVGTEMPVPDASCPPRDAECPP